MGISPPHCHGHTVPERRKRKVRRTGRLVQDYSAPEEEARNGSRLTMRYEGCCGPMLPFSKGLVDSVPASYSTSEPPQKQRTGLGIREGSGRPSKSGPTRGALFPTLPTTRNLIPQTPRLPGNTFGIYDSHSRMVQTPSKSSGTVTWETPLLCMICTPPSWLLDV